MPSLVVQQLRLRAPSAGGLGLTPVQGTRPLMPQLMVGVLQLRWKILSDATKTWSSQTNKLIKILEKKKVGGG